MLPSKLFVLTASVKNKGYSTTERLFYTTNCRTDEE